MVTGLLKITVASALVGFLGYCIYFDRKRRSDPEFRTKLAKKRRAQAIAAQKAALPSLPPMNDPRAVQNFFLEQLRCGEVALQMGSFDEAVQHFAYAAVVSGQTSHVLQILQQTLSPALFSKVLIAVPEVRKLVLEASNPFGTLQAEEDLE